MTPNNQSNSNVPFERTLSYEQLILHQRCFEGKGVRPSDVQSIRQLPNFFKSVMRGVNKLVRLGKQNSLIVLGLDAISYNFAAKVLTPDHLIPLTSTFPSTSVAGWYGTMTGLTAEQHGLPGVVFFAPEIGRMYNCLDEAIYKNGNWVQNSLDKHKVCYGEAETVFHQLAPYCDTIVIDGYFSYDIARWSKGLVRGAGKVLTSAANWSQITFNPHAIVDSITFDIERALSLRVKNRAVFVWSLVNTDHYIHVNGYSEELADALKILDNKILEWCNLGHTVVIHSDHGQVQNYSDTELEKAWNDINSLVNCRFISGGAGRTRWSYPKTMQETALANKIEKAFGREVQVLHKSELKETGLLKVGSKLDSQIGDIVTIALGNTFPIVNSSEDYYSKNSIKFEHGSILIDEMVVPLAIYQTR